MYDTWPPAWHVTCLPLPPDTCRVRAAVYLNGGIELSQPGVSPRQPGHVSLVSATTLSVAFHDPHHFLQTANKVEYFWSVNDKLNLGPFVDPTLV